MRFGGRSSELVVIGADGRAVTHGVLAASRVGPTWRDELEELARGWRLAGLRR